jgi:16S rRNA (guanine527-N7)-methyltransferase
VTGTERDTLVCAAADLGIAPSTWQLELLVRLVDILEKGNAAFNLTAIRDRPGMLQKHVLDSLTLQPYLCGERIADVGTGAGYPGLPLAVMNPARRFTLIEGTGKKARFVAATIDDLKLDNVEILHERAEKFRPLRLFDNVLARALSSLADFTANAGHLCAPTGRLFAMKGKRPDSEIAALPKAFRVVAVHRVRVPGLDDERHIVELCRAGPSLGRG